MYAQALLGEYRSGSRADTEPGQIRRRRPMLRQELQANSGCRLADHDHRAVTLQIGKGAALLGRFIQRLDGQQWHAVAGDTLRGQGLRQRRTVLGRTGQQQAPGAQG